MLGRPRLSARPLTGCGDDDTATAESASTSTLATTAVPFESIELGDGIVIEYALLTPPGFEPDGSSPVLLALPPGGQDRAVVAGTVSSIYAGEAARRGWVVVSPVAPGGQLYFQGSEQHLPE